MTNFYVSLRGKQYVCQISCKNNDFSRNYHPGEGQPPIEKSLIGLIYMLITLFIYTK